MNHHLLTKVERTNRLEEIIEFYGFPVFEVGPLARCDFDFVSVSSFLHMRSASRVLPLHRCKEKMNGGDLMIQKCLEVVPFPSIQ